MQQHGNDMAKVKTRIMGVVNITPDSFSDGGAYAQLEAAMNQIRALISAGADIVDIGAESTRPDATLLSADEEWTRLKPVVEQVRDLENAQNTVWSFDTRHGPTAQKICDMLLPQGLKLVVNDVSGGEDATMLELIAAQPEVKYCFMHHLSIPADKTQTLPEDGDVAQLIFNWAIRRQSIFSKAGIKRNQLIFDPGLGFGKTSAQNWQVIQGLSILRRLGFPMLIGHSRKSFLAEVTDALPQERDAASAMLTALLMERGVDYVRVHNVPMAVTARGIVARICQ